MKIGELRAKLKSMDKSELAELVVQIYKEIPRRVIEEKLIDDLIEDRELFLETRRGEREADREYKQAMKEENVTHIAAMQKWKSFPEYARNLILNNVWCTRCLDVRGLTRYTVEPSGPDIVLRGNCPVCNHEVARTVEIE
ncbi:hypothetical protein [Alicyclobacillus sp. SO9]|uniref:hypothetical protein n=1 Tax=Alicyclobacillus sp. SO9 TaxID=2665646 RepID=UPI0018E80BAD|nr:hypothetical protein [Alicyclobacillus sp. SO9]QQE79167.1 hypothetical protein GI364_01210 [Alicyclobacillus sp. SO9]